MRSRPPTVNCGSLVRRMRQAKGLGQVELARRIGTSQPAISRIERDEISPTLDMLARLFSAMGEALVVSSVRLDKPPPGGGNQAISELRADYNGLTAEERLSQAAQLSEIATELAWGGD